LIHAIDYNNRLQPTQIKLGVSGNPTSVVSLGYSYGATNNNGNVLTHTYSGGGLSYTQTFGYDSLNRLTTSNENGTNWSQTNAYDRYGNRWIDLGGGNQSLYFSTSNNRITGFSYDAAGNLLNDGAHSYTYDAENKIAKVDGATAYTYDGEGQRVRKLLAENLRLVYGIGGQLIAEFSGSTGSLLKEYIYGADGLLATIEPTAVNSNGTRYTTSDHLGSPRVVTNSGASVISRHDYMPFGEELGAGIGGRTTGMGFPGTSDGLRQKFTSKERDIETGLDYFGARYFSSMQGRFTGADEVWKDSQVADPQSWNKYACVRNNPLKYIDPNGEKATVTIETDEEHKRGRITVTASIALWTSNSTGLTQKDLQKAAQEYKENIEKSWKGTYEQDGIKYEINVTVDVQTYASEQAAMDSGAQNVLKVTEAGGHSGIREQSAYTAMMGGPDVGEIAVDAGTRKSEAAHEFTHMLGVNDRRSGFYLSNTHGDERAASATAYDYGWAFGGAINLHRFESRPIVATGRQWETLNAGPGSRGRERNHTSTRELRAPYYFWR
jgi:RHS repeat-associated protein